MNDLIFTPITLTTVWDLSLVLGASLICGLVIALVYRLGTEHPSKYMIITILTMPAIVQAVIMLVNGSIGAGVAVAGAFSLVRFRSLPGNSRDIVLLFFAMASGIAMGMGYVGYGALFTVVIAVVILLADRLVPSDHTKNSRLLKIYLPEDADYGSLFDDIFGEYAVSAVLDGVRTVRMGTMFELKYIVTLKDPKREKEMIDKIRCRNGNLTVSCGLFPADRAEL